MGIKDVLQKVFRKKDPEIYNPQREAIDKRHDALLRQRSFYQKKEEIPKLEAEIKEYDKRVYGNNMKSANGSILDVPNHFKSSDSTSVFEDIDRKYKEPKQMTKAERFREFARRRQEQLRKFGNQAEERLRELDRQKMAKIRAMRQRSARADSMRPQSQRMYVRQYQQPVNDGNLLHTPNAFAGSQQGYNQPNILTPSQHDLNRTPFMFGNDQYSMIQSPQRQPTQRFQKKQTAMRWL